MTTTATPEPPPVPKITDLQHGHTSPLISDTPPPGRIRSRFDELLDAARAMMCAPDPLRGLPGSRTAEATASLLALADQTTWPRRRRVA